MDLINLLVWFLVAGLILGLVWWVVNLPGSPIPAPFRFTIMAVMVLILIVILLRFLGVPSLTLDRP